MYPVVHCSIIYNNKDLGKQPKCPSTDEWIKMMEYILYSIYIYGVEYYLTIKKNEILPFATTWMDLKGIMVNEKSDRERKILCDVTYM